MKRANEPQENKVEAPAGVLRDGEVGCPGSVEATLELQVQQRTAALASANRSLEGLAHLLAHELKAPLRGIRGTCELVLEEHASDLPLDARQLLAGLQQRAEEACELLATLLDFARSSQEPLTKAWVDMRELFDSVAEEFREEVERRRVEIRVGPLHECEGDAALLRLVWRNLLSNALKYSAKAAQARILVVSEAQESQLLYRIHDNGVGFAPEQATRLFRAFARLDSARGFAGTGLGLLIAQNILERHGGHIRAMASLGNGATFEFTLPGPGRNGEASL